MDKTDLILCQLLLYNSRISYRELAEKLGLSVTAVHNRIQALIDQRVIRKFTAGLSILAQNAIHIFIYGASKTTSFPGLKGKLEKHGSIYWMAVAGGNILYVGAYLRNISELDGLVRFIRENAEVPEPTVAITGSPIPAGVDSLKLQTKLCELDYKIIGSMKDNSRKPIADIAKDTGVSAKTVRRRLNYMRRNFLIQLSIEWFPDESNDIISIFHVRFKDDANPNAANLILQKYYPNTLFYWSFTNLPCSYVFMVWTPTSKELREIRESFEAEPQIQSVSPNVIYTGYIIPSWRDTIP
ncbi:MAG: AsnC family transcriptional regulator [Candidatus Bathyarchaeota archaeon]|nr:AsnC family transcriptional regulator [Candidatus Bathyarchaeota archaeon]